MAEILMPPHLRVARTRFRYVDSTGVSVGEYTGAKITGSKGGDRLAASIELSPHGGPTTAGAADRAALIAFAARLRGKQNRAYLFDPANRIRGSFPAAELLTNNTFASGTTGWQGANATIAVRDRVLRASSNVGGTAFGFRNPAYPISVTQNAPHLARAYVSAVGPGANAGYVYIEDSNTVSTQAQVSGLTTGLASVVMVPTTGSVFVEPYNLTSTNMVGAYIDCPYTSLSRIALVDRGDNGVVRSDEFDNASWTKTRCSITANATTAPDGTATGDRLVEDSTASDTHFVLQATAVSSAAQDYSLAIALKAGTRTWGAVSIFEATGGTAAIQYINLSTGALGTGSVGANWSNLRSSVVSLGDGWYYICLVARKTNAATSIQSRIFVATADNTSIYSGNGSSYISAWRATFRASSVPTKLHQSAASSTSEVMNGAVLSVKGLPASTSGLLLPNDQFEVITSRGSELKIVTTSLDSDAAGLGYLQFEPPLRGAPADNAPIIIHQPMGRFIFNGEFPEWSNEPGVFTSASLDFEEAA
jgi:hypothetical protein